MNIYKYKHAGFFTWGSPKIVRFNTKMVQFRMSWDTAPF